VPEKGGIVDSPLANDVKEVLVLDKDFVGRMEAAVGSRRL
jgi:hypothetical protein